MKSYKIYLTKSREVAGLLQSHFCREMNSERDRILRVAFGTTTGKKRSRKSTTKMACVTALWSGTTAVIAMRLFLRRRTSQWTQLTPT